MSRRTDDLCDCDLKAKEALGSRLELPRSVTFTYPEYLGVENCPNDPKQNSENCKRQARGTVEKANDGEDDGDPRRPDDGVEHKASPGGVSFLVRCISERSAAATHQ